jgi:hypothetical protein
MVMFIFVIRVDLLKGRHATGVHPLAKIEEWLSVVKGIPMVSKVVHHHVWASHIAIVHYGQLYACLAKLIVSTRVRIVHPLSLLC